MKASAEVMGRIEFDEVRFDEMVESITVEKDGKLQFFPLLKRWIRSV